MQFLSAQRWLWLGLLTSWVLFRRLHLRGNLSIQILARSVFSRAPPAP